MNYLLDTNALLWFLHKDKRLSVTAYNAIETADRVYVSVASLWEVAIKCRLGKLTLSEPYENFFPKQLVLGGIDVLPIRIEHLYIVNELPIYHRDPFDRLIIAQAMVEKVPIISKDGAFSNYDVEIVW